MTTDTETAREARIVCKHLGAPYVCDRCIASALTAERIDELELALEECLDLDSYASNRIAFLRATLKGEGK